MVHVTIYNAHLTCTPIGFEHSTMLQYKLDYYYYFYYRSFYNPLLLVPNVIFDIDIKRLFIL